MQTVLIVAIAENGVIGRDNAIPWRIKADMQRFRALTMGKPVIMGRKNFQSLARPLVGRTNVVVTRDAQFHADGALVVTSLARAFEAARGDALRRFATEIIVMGGAEIYDQCMPCADRLEITQVHATIDGDTRFQPDISDFEEVARERHKAGEGDSADYSYVTLRRRKRAH
jgi:dihydrofolate reductase